ncbi:rRNA small subunit methyltransferase 1 [Patescibacteria group bacterium]|nr:rRNA small subunit methyltransferase 1 [Patescibacteria group bacterium]
MEGKLYIVATPIGNLGDITLRALETLKSVDFVLCEDTRVTQKLLNHYEIKTPTISYHQHSKDKKINEIIKLLEEGKNLALVTDAGTPGISDPGNWLVRHVVIPSDPDDEVGGVEGSLSEAQKRDPSTSPSEGFGRNDIGVIPIPGPSALTTALSISGFPTDKFLFLGFPPHKKGRKKFFQEVVDAKHTVIFYESCHRIKKCITELGEILDKSAKMCICRELTKKFETIYRGNISNVEEMDILEKGEFVVVVSSRPKS